jgi:hypothetical protein
MLKNNGIIIKLSEPQNLNTAPPRFIFFDKMKKILKVNNKLYRTSKKALITSCDVFKAMSNTIMLDNKKFSLKVPNATRNAINAYLQICHTRDTSCLINLDFKNLVSFLLFNDLYPINFMENETLEYYICKFQELNILEDYAIRNGLRHVIALI